MKVELFSFVGMYDKGLSSLENILAKGQAHAKTVGVSESDMLEWRLAPDMFPLRRQAQIVCNFATEWPARACGLPPLPAIEGESTFSDLMAAIGRAENFLADIDPAQFEGRDDFLLKHDIGQLVPTMPIGQWMSGFATTNFYFHLSMAYAILRTKGVALGKRDIFAGGL